MTLIINYLINFIVIFKQCEFNSVNSGSFLAFFIGFLAVFFGSISVLKKLK